MDEFSDRVIVVTGRSPDVANFVEFVSAFLYDNYTIGVAQPLEEEDERGVDGNLRFIGFVVGTEIDGTTADNQAMRIKQSGGMLNAVVFSTMDEAMAEAKTRFGFQTGSEALGRRAESVKEIIKKYPPFTADEIERFRIFHSLIENGQIVMIRGLLEDEKPVCLLALVTGAEDNSHKKMSVFGMMNNDYVSDLYTLAYEELEDV